MQLWMPKQTQPDNPGANLAAKTSSGVVTLVLLSAVAVVSLLVQLPQVSAQQKPATFKLTPSEEKDRHVLELESQNLQLRVNNTVQQLFGGELQRQDAKVGTWVTETLKAHGNPKDVQWSAQRFQFVTVEPAAATPAPAAAPAAAPTPAPGVAPAQTPKSAPPAASKTGSNAPKADQGPAAGGKKAPH